jgi:hypothetical protein
MTVPFSLGSSLGTVWVPTGLAEHVSDLPGLNQIAEWLTTRVEAGKKGCCPVCNAEIIQPILVVGRRPPAVSREPPSPCALCIISMMVIVCSIVILTFIVHVATIT